MAALAMHIAVTLIACNVGGGRAGEPRDWAGLMVAKRNVFALKSEDRYLHALSRCKKVLLY
jgi:hypothetical protein